MRIPARWVVLPLLAAPLGAGALELGEIDIRSALNQPFLARIGLQVEALDEREGLSVELASQETFERYGLDRPEFLSSLEFRVARTADGSDFVLVSSQDPIAEPFVTMLVEATWQRGRVLREYTVLLDPPLLLPEPVAAVPVEPAETQAPQANIPRSAPPTPESPEPQDPPALEPSPQAPPTPESPEPQDAPEPQNASELEPSPQAPPSPEVTPVLADGGSHGPVQRGETLWGIAESYRPEDITVYQMLVALYEANPGAFGANMNLLYAGAVLRIPERAELVGYTASASVAEFVRQTDEWQGRVQQQARLRLLPPDPDPDPGTAASAAEAGAASRDSDVGELREEVAALQSELDESQRLLELRDQELRDLQAQLSAANAAESAGASPAADPGSEPVFADESGSAPGEATGADRPPEPAAAPSFVARVWQFVTGPFVLIAIAAALVVFTAFLFRRRRQRSELPAFDLRMMTAGLHDAVAGDADPKGSRSEDKRTPAAPPEDAPKADAPPEDAPTADAPTADEIGSKLDLARAYTDMGDADSARKVLAEVLEDGDPDQRREAQALLDALDE